MRPPKLHVTLLSAILLMRSDARLLAARIGIEVLGATFFALALGVAGGWIARTPFALHAWTGGALAALVGAVVYFVLRVIARVGVISVVFARARKVHSPGIVVAGAEGFTEGAIGMAVLSLLDVLALGCVGLVLQLGARVTATHGPLGAAVSAVCIAAIIVAALLATTFASFAFVLGVMDGDGLFVAWPRALRLVMAPEVDAPARFWPLFAVLGLIGTVASIVDFLSSAVSSVGSGQEGSFVVIPILTLGYAMLCDLAAMVFLAALSDRLPLGFATPITLASPRGPA